jgi:beta-lactamase class A
MKKFRNFSLVRWISLALVISAVLLLVFQLIVFSRLRSSFSTGTKIAGVDVAGLDENQAASRITQAFSIPIELRYGENIIQVKPSVLGFSLDLGTMMAAADQARVSLPFWTAFWDYLFSSLPGSGETPMRANIDDGQMRSFLINEIAARYDEPPAPYTPITGSVYYEPGKPGKVLDVDRSVELITEALKNPSSRIVNLVTSQSSSARPSLSNLKVFLEQIIDVDGFTGEAEMYLLDLQNGQELQFAYSQGEQLTPDIAFSADSTIKIPIMIDAFKRVDEPPSLEISTLIENMIVRSDNIAPDSLMRALISPTLGPLDITKTIRALGLKNTFLAGMFYQGAPLLDVVTTQANKRTDINTQPDPYNQTTPTEMGMLLSDIYQCAQTGGGTFAAVFPGKISQNECKSMITYLTRNKIGVLIEAGLPEGTQIGHKHGWAVDPVDGVMHTVADAALIYSPGGNYILTIYIHNSDQIVWDNANRLYADLSRAVYNYFNLTSQ